MKKRNNDTKRHYKDIKKIIRMKWRLLAFTKGVTRRLGRFHSLKKDQGHPNQTKLKKHLNHPNHINLKKYQGPLMIQARKNRSLKKPMGKRPLKRQEKS